MPTFSFSTPWPALLVWCLLYISDYAFTVTCARLYRGQEKIAFEGSYELTPFFQRDIDALRIVSTRFLAVLLSTLIMIGLLWALTAESLPELFQFAMGSLIVVQLAIHMRHLRNLSLFRAVNYTEEVRGRIEYARTLALRMSSSECLAFSGLFLVLFGFTRSWFILGGAVGCFLLAIKHRKLASKLRSSVGTAVQVPPQ